MEHIRCSIYKSFLRLSDPDPQYSYNVIPLEKCVPKVHYAHLHATLPRNLSHGLDPQVPESSTSNDKIALSLYRKFMIII